MAKKKSKFQEMLEKAKDTVKLDHIQARPAIPEAQLLAILENNSIEETKVSTKKDDHLQPEVKEDFGLYLTKEQKQEHDRVMKEVLHPSRRKAYNIWYNKDIKCYIKDTIEYEGPLLVDYKSEKLTVSQALAMAEVTKVFGEKLILKKEGV